MAAETSTSSDPNHSLNRRREDKMAEQFASEGINRSTDVAVHTLDLAQSWIALQGSFFLTVGDSLQHTARLLTQMAQQAASTQERIRRTGS